MRRFVKLFLCVLSISFVGSLPPGTLNTGVTGLVVNRGAFAAIQFGVGAVLVEIILVRIALAGIGLLKKAGHVLRWGRKGAVMSGAVVVGSMVLGVVVWALYALYRGGMAGAYWGGVPLISGLLLSLLNPLHLPFWMGWAAVLRSKRVVGDTAVEYNVFVVAIGLGTALAFLVYGMAGHFFIRWLQINKGLLNWLIALTFLVTGLLQLYRVLRQRRMRPGEAGQ